MEASPDDAAKVQKRGEKLGLSPLLFFAFSAAVVLALAVVITWPLWKLAFSSRPWYNAIFAVSLLSLFISAIVSRLRRKRRGAYGKEVKT
jgi:phosphoglycerol transferase MdoB-like AlkP superfamily enzyme